MPYVGLRKRGGNGGKTLKRARTLCPRRRRDYRAWKEKEKNVHEGSRHETNEYRKGRPWLSQYASQNEGKNEDDGKKPREQKREDAATSNGPRVRPSSRLPLQQDARSRQSRPGPKHAAEKKRERMNKNKRKKEKGMERHEAPGTTTLDSYNCSFLQIPQFLPATAKFGNLRREP